MAQVKKLSVATVYGKIDLKQVINSDKPIAVMRVAGQAVGTKSGDSNYGTWTALVGSFVAIHPETGEQSEAAQLFLPEVALIPIQVALASANARAIDFAIELQVKASENTKPGGSPYEYTFTNLMAPAENDPMAKLRNLLTAGDKPAALPGPVADDTQAAKPATKSAKK
ncbi:MAG: hypothetical protein ACOYBQ_10220 [Fluviibacter sp.]